MFLINRKTLALIGATAAAIGSTAFFAAPAQAAGAGLAKVVGSKTVSFQALMGKANGVTVTISGKTVTLTDKVAIKAGKGCKSVSAKKVRCKTSAKTKTLRIALGDKNDWVRNKTNVHMVADGGSGNDTLTGGGAWEYLYGGTGKDKIYGNGGNDEIVGGSAIDLLRGGAGNDKIFGDSGNDKIYGDAGQDKLYGDSGADLIYGGNDVDVVRAGSGNDWIYGGAGQYTEGELIYGDTIYGEDGNDTIRGEADTDIVEGGAGADRIWGEDGDDLLAGDSYIYDGVDYLPYGGDSATDAVNGGANGHLGDVCVVTGSSSVSECEGPQQSSLSKSAKKAARPENIRRAG
ncbi:calcium-binding protein [Actinoplanes sp. NEAU-A12]|uniref:Calcium-binding protein n=1 Tax=Actinoplanes sandaracinus TaxID=3045177 RepID=A0ABT6WSW0_9ACTN|nr:calcium-binding protein [Actinoplanes sandaracinus]MDI6102827.1 calcium-binding protein [Actinoplanes sandaracinus]